MLVFQRTALSMPKLYKNITTSPRRAGSVKKRHDRNQRQPKKKVNTINNNIDNNNTKNKNKVNKRNTDNNNTNNTNNSNNSKKQSNELNINKTIEERLTKLESKVKHMWIETKNSKVAQQKASYKR